MLILFPYLGQTSLKRMVRIAGWREQWRFDIQSLPDAGNPAPACETHRIRKQPDGAISKTMRRNSDASAQQQGKAARHLRESKKSRMDKRSMEPHAHPA
jgi:hypothetical protein